jgi:A/G-specific adenine glycosylase
MEGRVIPQTWIVAVRRELNSWYDAAHRVLPWRKRPDPYQVLVSEMMLVQTTVAAVVPFFERFLRRFPNVQALAQAEEGEVLKAWEGLGYYRRARQLQAAARRIVEHHHGKVPQDSPALRELPGVGRYMAGAILSFAYDLPEPIVEANSQRVLARLFAWREELKARVSERWLWDVAGQLVPSRGAGTFNQAIMDLGALVCTQRAPRCLVCPLAAFCESRRLGLQDALPVSSPKPRPLAVVEACALVLRRGTVLLVQRKEGGLWSKFWEFPTVHVDGADPAGRSFGGSVELAEGVARLTGIQARVGPEVLRLTYAVTKHRVSLRVHLAHALSGRLKPGARVADARFMPPEALTGLPLGSAARRLATWIGQRGASLEGWDRS